MLIASESFVFRNEKSVLKTSKIGQSAYRNVERQFEGFLGSGNVAKTPL
jgi:hypothetical protein